MLNIQGDPGESGSVGQFAMIARYEERVYAIIRNIKPKNPDSISSCLSVYKRVIDSFLGTLLSGSIGPCRAALVIHHDIPAQDDFQALIAELGTHLILSGETEVFLWHMINHPDIFQKRGFVLENPKIQEVLIARIHLLESNGQHRVANKLREEFLRENQ